MCTKPRIIVPQVFYEVTSRGVDGVKIFPDDESKTLFLKELAITLQKYSFQCFGWSIMDDHYHLVVKSSDSSVSSFMQRLNSSYAKYFNLKSGRKGVVFYRRFASVIVQENDGLRQLIRHIHLNPVRCCVCTIEELDNYNWCGHKTITNSGTDDIINVTEVIKVFSQSGSSAGYRDFIRSGEQDQRFINKMRDANEGKQIFTNLKYWIIGDQNFVRRVLNQDRCRRIRIACHVRENMTLDNLLEKIKSCIPFNIPDFYLHGRLNEISTFRQLFAVAGRSHFEFSCSTLADYLRVSKSAVSRMISRSTRIKELDYLKSMLCIV